MGKYDLGDGLGRCLIGLAIGALVAAGSQVAQAQEMPGAAGPSTEAAAPSGETANDDGAEEPAPPATEETETEEAAAGAGDAASGEAGADSAAAEEAGSTETGTEAAESEEIHVQAAAERAATEDSDKPAGDHAEQERTEADLRSGFESAPPAGGETATGIDETARDINDSAPIDDGAAAGTQPAAGEQTAVDGIPANEASSGTSATPALARDPMTGADEPLEYEPGDIDENEEVAGTGDPLEGMNRAFFHFNDFLDKLILKPTASLYRFILPDYVEDRVRNVVNNADSPVILANDILQWKWDRAWNTTSRFFINTTLGVGGIWDVAASFGIDRHEEDFGQTLCVWGVNEWVYLYLPFVGPTSPRDLTGKVVDRFFDPLSYYADVVQQVNLSNGVQIKWNIDRAGWASIALTSADLIDMRARNIDTINEIERTSIDFYTAVRSLYRQSRESACNDGKVDFEDLPDLSEEFE